MEKVLSEKTKFADMFKKAFFTVLLLCTVALSAQHNLQVKVTGIPKSEGHIRVALYTSADGFLKFEQVYRAGSAKTSKGTTQIVFKDLPQGTYAIALYHDENSNSELDKNWLGIPKEKVAFSKAKMRAFGPPPFKDCAFKLQEDMLIEIPISKS
ncbi:DUF2141 domain-containing protein [Aureicoccus marinus]|nr:DUF2141 domain-containing protein [Aureicoccus marinus]